jgi:hypothetical protein
VEVCENVASADADATITGFYNSHVAHLNDATKKAALAAAFGTANTAALNAANMSVAYEYKKGTASGNYADLVATTAATTTAAATETTAAATAVTTAAATATTAAAAASTAAATEAATTAAAATTKAAADDETSAGYEMSAVTALALAAFANLLC